MLRPLRTAPTGQGFGRRVYGAAEVARLGQITALKRAGFTLKRIGELMGGFKGLDPLTLVEAQISALQAQAQAVERGLKSLRAARDQLRDGRSLDISDLCDLIRRGDEIMQSTGIAGEAWARVFERYYDTEDLQNWDKASAKFTPDDADGYGARWRELIARVEAAVAAGLAPDSPEAMQLAVDWYDLQRPLVEAVGAATWGKAAQMYADMESWRGQGAEPPFSKAVYDYAGAAMAAARAAGRVPPPRG